MMNPLTIDIVSDLVCPWCFIGKRHLESAIASMGESAPMVQIRWHPFQLNPDLPHEGIARKTYVETKFGGAARAAEVYGRVTLAGATVGLDLQFNKIQQQPNTRAAHALVALAQEAGKGDEVVEALFRAYFFDGVFIGETETLVDIATRNGLDAARVRTALNDEQTLNAISAQDSATRAQGISGVPFFVFGNAHALSGAQPPAEMVRAIRAAMG